MLVTASTDIAFNRKKEDTSDLCILLEAGLLINKAKTHEHADFIHFNDYFIRKQERKRICTEKGDSINSYSPFYIIG